jgi:alanine racemase
VVLFGAYPGAPDAEEIADLMETIPYEVTCLITKRVPRVYIDQEGVTDVCG